MESADDEEKILRSVALQNVQTILQARQRAEQELLKTKEALEEETRILELLNKTGAMLTSNLDVQSVVQAVTDAGTQLSGAQFGAFFHTELRADGGALTLFTLSGAPREAFERFGHPRATPIFAPTFAGEGVIRSSDVRKDPRYGQVSPHFGMPEGHLPVASYLAVPVITRSGEVIGGLFFGHAEPDVFTERAERLIVGIAAQAAIAIDNARLYEQAKRAADERARLLEAERRARAEIERVSLMKDEFLSTLSHELRTPLNAVLGWSEVLLTRSDEKSDTRRGIEAIVRNARAQAQLIEDLFDMSSIVSGTIRLAGQVVELAPIVDAAIDSVLPSTNAKEITVRRSLDALAGAVFGDPQRLQQVVWNLMTNAVKFTPKGGTIDVFVERVESMVEIVVHDSGVGIDADFLPHVFERFRQADSSSTRRFGGLGLGLSIVRQLVELQGGTVSVESAGLGKGATFTVRLPLRAAPQADAGRAVHGSSARIVQRERPAISLRGVTVLVVDDDPDARELVASVLLDSGADVLSAGSAAEALTLLKARRVAVIVSDIGMPDRDGYQLLRDIRALPAEAGGRTLAIALTAFARSEERARALDAGYQLHVAKPIDPQELVVTIARLLEGSVERT